MRFKFTYIIPLLAVCMAGCSKTKVAPTPQLSIPVGSFTGQFSRLHLTVATGKIDTLLATLTLTLDASKNFAITGDTSKVHAGSFGKCALGITDELVFTDKTLPAAGTPVKQHLNGTYAYVLSSGVLELDKTVGDSISYKYYLTKN